MKSYEHRKSSCTLVVRDKEGRPVTGRDVCAELERHEFLFGCGAFELLPLLDPATPEPERAHLQRLWDAWQELFNYGTLPFYQGRYEPTQGCPDELRMRRAADELAAKGYQAKGHPLCWHTVAAPWLMPLSDEQVLENQKARIRRDMGAFRDVIRFWDVINEVVIMPEFEKEENAITRLCQRMGRVPLVKAVFDMARQTDPDATLLINDFNLSERYRQLIEDCLAAGVPIDAIGLQTHQHQGAWGREKLEQTIERFAGFGLPLHFTENTFVSGQLMPPEIVDLNDYQVPEWPSTPAGEDRQARDMLEMADTLFESPAVTAFTNWSIVDGQWLKAPAGLLREDGSRKPAFDALRQRIRGDWHTRVTLHTNDAGECVLEGFRGAYRVASAEGEARLTLDSRTSRQTVTLN